MDISSTSFNAQSERGNSRSGTNAPDMKNSGRFQAEVDVQIRPMTSGENVEKNSYSPASFSTPFIVAQANSARVDIFFDLNQDTEAAENADGINISKADDKAYMVNSNHGQIELDLDDYFSDDPKHYANIADVPLLLPSRSNLKVLSEHATERFQQLLKDYDIPSAPETINYNPEGKMILPNDYAYAKELKAAFEQNTGLDRELRTLHAISSHVVEIEKRMPFVEAMQLASTQAEIDRLIEKYSHLLNDNENYSEITLKFSKGGRLVFLLTGSRCL